MSEKPKPSETSGRILLIRNTYASLLSYQKAEVIYDVTFHFTHRFLRRGDRTVDQMVQAARSGKQNILEGNKAASSSKETELKLTSVARASLEELLDDYRDFLRVRDLPLWSKNSKEAVYVRNMGRVTPQKFDIYKDIVLTRRADIVANLAVCLVHQANYLLDRQLEGLEREFLKKGGLRERMTSARLQSRGATK
jgi:four helix bundle suffix protein